MRTSRSLILDVGVRALFHTVLLISLFLLFAGHNAPGGGFVAGLVAGAAFLLRDVATSFDPSVRQPRVAAEVVLGLGWLCATTTGIVALLFDGELLESARSSVTLPVFATVKLNSALAFDVGVYLVVIGMVLIVMERLGEEPN